ncbi:MAG TPA: hypothetical protein DCG75_10370 [Bacteroidales bacterium]|nr:hypothetical protein [Bacteroidales bacterium]
MIRFRKIFNFGPFRTSLSKSGVGFSWGLPGLRFGVSPNGRKYFSIGIPGTGLYMIKYFESPQKKNYQTPTNTNQTNAQPKKIEPWWKQKNLMD